MRRFVFEDPKDLSPLLINTNVSYWVFPSVYYYTNTADPQGFMVTVSHSEH